MERSEVEYSDSEIEKYHSHCADLLMSEYGIEKKHRVRICKEIHEIYNHTTMIHCQIIWSVRGYFPVPFTQNLKMLLDQLKTHPPLNHKPLAL